MDNDQFPPIEGNKSEPTELVLFGVFVVLFFAGMLFFF
jgi:hypothetical protein